MLFAIGLVANQRGIAASRTPIMMRRPTAVTPLPSKSWQLSGGPRRLPRPPRPEAPGYDCPAGRPRMGGRGNHLCGLWGTGSGAVVPRTDRGMTRPAWHAVRRAWHTDRPTLIIYAPSPPSLHGRYGTVEYACHRACAVRVRSHGSVRLPILVRSPQTPPGPPVPHSRLSAIPHRTPDG